MNLVKDVLVGFITLFQNVSIQFSECDYLDLVFVVADIMSGVHLSSL